MSSAPVTTAPAPAPAPPSQQPPQQQQQKQQNQQNQQQQKQQPASQKKAKATAVDPQVFISWCENELKAVTTCDVQTLISFLVALDNPKDICDYISEYLGKSKEVDAKKFAEMFIKRRNQEGTLRGTFAPEMWRASAPEVKKVGCFSFLFFYFSLLSSFRQVTV
jgi:hypothetical protein